MAEMKKQQNDIDKAAESSPPTTEVNQAENSTQSDAHPRAEVARLPEQFGRYRIVRRLGQGAMGDIYLAEDTQLERQVALKVPKLELENKNLLSRFYREARAAAGLHHRNICPVFDVGEIDGVHYLTMAFVEGKPLSAYVRPGKPLPVRSAVAIVRKLALALSKAHSRGILHRDLKPANVMIDGSKQPVVMDFGLARKFNAEESRLTQTGSLVGTPAYMSPEQVKGELDELGPTSDVYSLGIIFYELLTGRVPFEGPIASVLGQILAVDPQPPSVHRQKLDPSLEAICLKAMSKPIEERYASMSEFAQALTDWARGFSRDTAAAPEVVADVQPLDGDTVVPAAENMDHFLESMAGVKNQHLKSLRERGSATSRRRKPIAAFWNRTPPIQRLMGAVACVAALSILGAIIVIRTDGPTVEIDTEGENTIVVAQNDKITVTTTPTDQQPKPDEKPDSQTVNPPEPKESPSEGPPVVDEDSLTKNEDSAPETSDSKPAQTPDSKDSQEEPPNVAVESTEPSTNESADRVAAEWVLNTGGSITLFSGDEIISKLEDIPKGELELIKVNLYDKKNVDDAGLQNLSGLTQIEELNLTSTAVGDAGVAHLRELKTLKVLELGSTSISDAGLSNLSGLTAITELILYKTPITDDGMQHLESLSNLRQLNLESTRIRGGGLAVLAGIS